MCFTCFQAYLWIDDKYWVQVTNKNPAYMFVQEILCKIYYVYIYIYIYIIYKQNHTCLNVCNTNIHLVHIIKSPAGSSPSDFRHAAERSENPFRFAPWLSLLFDGSKIRRFHQLRLGSLHPWKLTWNLEMMFFFNRNLHHFQVLCLFWGVYPIIYKIIHLRWLFDGISEASTAIIGKIIQTKTFPPAGKQLLKSRLKSKEGNTIDTLSNYHSKIKMLG